jgi:hypothetical protein
MKSRLAEGIRLFFAVLALWCAICPNMSGQAPAPPQPIIEILSPKDGAVFKVHSIVNITVQGADIASFGHVIRIFDGTTLLDSVVLDPLQPKRDTFVPFNLTFPSHHVRPGTHVLTATIDDTSSDPVTITVKTKRGGHHSLR